MKYICANLELEWEFAPSDDIDFVAAELLWRALEVGAHANRGMGIEAYCMHIDQLFTRYSDLYYGGENWDNPRRKSRLEP